MLSSASSRVHCFFACACFLSALHLRFHLHFMCSPFAPLASHMTLHAFRFPYSSFAHCFYLLLCFPTCEDLLGIFPSFFSVSSCSLTWGASHNFTRIACSLHNYARNFSLKTRRPAAVHSGPLGILAAPHVIDPLFLSAVSMRLYYYAQTVFTAPSVRVHLT